MATQQEYTVTQAAKTLGCGVSTVRKHAAYLGAAKFGKAYRLTAADVEAIRARLANEDRPGRRVAALDSLELGATPSRRRRQAIGHKVRQPARGRQASVDGRTAGMHYEATK